MELFAVLWILVVQSLLGRTIASPLETLDRRVTVNPTCSGYSSEVNDAIQTVQDMCTATLNSVQWILDHYSNDNTDDQQQTHQMRIAIPMITMLAIDLEQNGVDTVNRRRLEQLKGGWPWISYEVSGIDWLTRHNLPPAIVTGVKRAVTRDNGLPVFCHHGFRKRTTENNGQITYWDTLWELSSPSPTCEDQPKYGYMMYKDPRRTNTEERLVICPERLAEFKHKPSLSSYRSHPEKLPYKPLNTLRDTIAVIVFHELTHSKLAGKCMDSSSPFRSMFHRALAIHADFRSSNRC